MYYGVVERLALVRQAMWLHDRITTRFESELCTFYVVFVLTLSNKCPEKKCHLPQVEKNTYASKPFDLL